MSLTIVETGDGLHSLYLPELQEHYHSSHGALTEANHIFIDKGLLYTKELIHGELSILEVGFGTGLNAYLTLLAAQKINLPVRYVGLELYPVSANLIQQLNYVERILNQTSDPLFDLIHAMPWNKEGLVSQNFRLTKLQLSVFDFKASSPFNLIYFDAFGYRAQEEMWSEVVFKTMFDSLQPGGVLVTYCSKGLVRRTMESCGFLVEKMPGPKGKREMVRAYKPKI